MPWPLIKLLPKKTNFKFVRFAIFAAFLSIVAVAGSFVAMFTGGLRDNPIAVYQAAEGDPLARIGAVMSRGFNLGIDFRGGTSMEIRSPGGRIDSASLQGALAEMHLGEVEVQNYSDASRATVSFQTPGANPSAVVERVRAQISRVVPNVEFGSVDAISGKVSEELFSGGLIALGLAIVLMLIYIAFRFEFQFGVGAVFA
ncbi:MAG: hypothetical protein JSS00_07525, partial [Proteobacteria bacterium]|nr:hypothetical protein [Pseudomonadota bacterium]